MKSRVIGLLGCAVLVVSLAACGDEDSGVGLCLDLCASMAAPKCEQWGADKYKECEDGCRKSEKVEDGDRICEKEAMAYVQCVAHAKYVCEAGYPTMEEGQCESEHVAYDRCKE